MYPIRKETLLYIKVLKAFYGMLKPALLSYIKLIKYLDAYGFKFNPYDPCVATKIIEGEPTTTVLHVDDIKPSQNDTKAEYKF